MSSFAAIFPSMRRPPPSALQPPPDQLADLRFALEVMPGSRKYVFTPAARAEILAKLYASFMGSHPQLFLGGPGKVPQHMLLSEYQASVAASGTGPATWKEKAEAVIPGRPCTYIFKKGECCFRCKCVLFFCSIHLCSADYCTQGTVRWTTAASSAPDVFMPQITQITTSASSSLNSQAEPAIAATLRPGGVPWGAPIIRHLLTQKNWQRSSSPVNASHRAPCPATFLPSKITLSVFSKFPTTSES
jgi:hypothetical protein